ncbi:MAG: DUF4390 domain-containing protein [Limnohabitans sp.]|nr:DUF4390 domain-containing protein [Limnohabitans sp.]
MQSVIMMDFSTRYFRKPIELWRWRDKAAHTMWFLIAVFLTTLSITPTLHAQPLTLQDLKIERQGDGFYMGASLNFELPPSAEEALAKGVPLNFVLRCDIVKERWYWTNKKIVQIERYMRLSFQPLSRRWRVHISGEPITQTGLGVVFGQSFDSQVEALAALRRFNRWRIADANQIEADTKYQLEVNFKLDLTQLPRPLQIGALGASDWTLNLNHQQMWALEPIK